MPSGLSGLSILIIRAPVIHNKLDPKGPANKDERSSIRGFFKIALLYSLNENQLFGLSGMLTSPTAKPMSIARDNR